MTNLNLVSLTIDGSGRLYAGSDCNSWSAINSGLTVDPAKPPLAIVVDPGNTANLYAGLDGAGIFRSMGASVTPSPVASRHPLPHGEGN